MRARRARRMLLVACPCLRVGCCSCRAIGASVARRGCLLHIMWCEAVRCSYSVLGAILHQSCSLFMMRAALTRYGFSGMLRTVVVAGIGVDEPFLSLHSRSWPMARHS
eukprot:scaffold104_cov33-Tisochrysis_lutea.AAC.3